jgi:hypothetical protein
MHKTTQIIHFVSQSHEIPMVSRLNSIHLLPIEESRPVAIEKTGKPRIHLATAASTLMTEARELLNAGKVSEAFSLLKIAISHDELLISRAPKEYAGGRAHRETKKATRKDRQSARLARKRPNFQLYDFVANAARKHGQTMAIVIEPFQKSLSDPDGYPTESYSRRAIEERIKKWSDPTSAWNHKGV